MGQCAPLPPVTILLVEDEVLVRMECADLLADMGLTVLEANDADEAIALLDDHPDIEVMMTDIDMPGSMDGIRLAAHVHRRFPPVKILVVSGNVGAAVPDLPLDAMFLAKPYENRRLVSALVGLMGHGA